MTQCVKRLRNQIKKEYQMAKKQRKKTTYSKFNKVNFLLQNVEDNLNKVVSQARKQSMNIIHNLNASELSHKAMRKGSQIKREIKRLSLDVSDNMVDVVKGNISNTFHKIQESEIVELAKVKMKGSKNQLLNSFEIPSQSDLKRLNLKLANLERKLNAIQKNNNVQL